MKITKIKISFSLAVVLFSGLFCLAKLNIINIENFTFFSLQSAPKRPTLAIDRIILFERYAYEFDSYLGSTGEAGNNSRIIEQNAVLRKPYSFNNKVRITPAVANFNEGIPLEQARIQFTFDQGVIVKNHQGWAEQEVNSRYSYKFSEPINNVPLNTGNSLFVSFPEQGRYKINVLIDGKYLESLKEVNYSIELYE